MKIQRWAWSMVLSLPLLGTTPADASQPGLVVAWGLNNCGQTNVPPGLSNVIAIAAGGWHSVALQANGTVVAWGLDNFGQTNVPPGLSNVAAIAAGGSHNLVLQSNGMVMAWGNNEYGQTNVPPGLSNVIAIAAGGSHSLALQSNGCVASWGYYSQASVPLGLSNVVAIAAGENHSLALQRNGTVAAWGYNSYGQAAVPLGLSNVIAIAGGGDHSLVLQSNGTLVAWGDNDSGQTNAPSGLGGVTAIAAGGDHNLVLQAGGDVLGWGSDLYGETNTPAGLNNVAAISAGYSHNLAITQLIILSNTPTPVSLALGAATSMGVAVFSASPFGCQWSLNGLVIAGATGTTFLISSFDFTKAGNYLITVTNQSGYATAASVLRLTNSPVVLVDGVDVGGGTASRVDASHVTMSTTFGSDAKVYYSLDGSEPDFSATSYSSIFTITNSSTIRAIAYNSAYTDWAEAAPIYVQIWPTYPLLAGTAGGGIVRVIPGAFSGGNRYVSNTIVTITATPSNGWSFLQWTGDSLLTTNVVTVLMDRPHALQASFGTALNVFTNGGGQVLTYPPSGPYTFGSVVRLTALPLQGYYFFGWAGAANGFSNPLSFTVTNASEVTALFAALKSNQVSLTVLPSGNGAVAISPTKNVYTNGDVVTLTAVPATNYAFCGWSGGASGVINPLVVTLNTNKLITANFGLGTSTNPPPMIQTVTITAGVLSFTWISVPGRAYQVLCSTGLSAGSWTKLGGTVTATNGLMSASDTISPSSLRFYRVELLP